MRNLLEEAREELANMLGVNPERVVFNSGATEGINAVMRYEALQNASGMCLLSPTEHPAVLEAAQLYFGERCKMLEVDRAGLVDMERLSERAAMVAVMAANNETGVIQAVQEIADRTHNTNESYETYLCDASQYLGKMPTALLPREAWLIGCGHKFGGPKGVGFIVMPSGVTGFRSQVGGGQESDHRGGTENYPAIAAMLAALRHTSLLANVDAFRMTGQSTKRALIDRLTAELGEGMQVVSAEAETLWNTVMLIMPRFRNTRWVTRLDKKGFQVSTGSACATAKAGSSHVLKAMGYSDDEAQRAIRISAGWETTADDWKALGEAVITVWKELQAEEDDASSAGTRVIQI